MSRKDGPSLAYLVPARAPELVKARATDDERGVNLQAIRAESRILKVFPKLTARRHLRSGRVGGARINMLVI